MCVQQIPAHKYITAPPHTDESPHSLISTPSCVLQVLNNGYNVTGLIPYHGNIWTFFSGGWHFKPYITHSRLAIQICLENPWEASGWVGPVIAWLVTTIGPITGTWRHNASPPLVFDMELLLQYFYLGGYILYVSIVGIKANGSDL